MTTDIRILKTGICPSLSGKSKLTFEVGADAASTISLRITGNTGSGAFSNAWIGLDRVGQVLEKTAEEPITSHTLSPLYKGKSANSPGFLLAAMKHVGLVRPPADNPRCYERLDGKGFFSEIQALMGSKAAAAPKPATIKQASSPTPAAPPKASATKSATAPKGHHRNRHQRIRPPQRSRRNPRRLSPPSTSRKFTGRWYLRLGSPPRERRPSADIFRRLPVPSR